MNLSVFVNITRWIFRILYIILWILFAIMSVAFVLSIFKPDLMADSVVFLPVELTIENISFVAEDHANKLSAYIEGAHGNVGFLQTIPMVGYLGYVLALLQILAVLYVFRFIIRLIKSVANKNPFSVQNFKGLRNIAVIYISLTTVSWFFNMWGEHYVQSRLIFDAASGVSANFSLTGHLLGLPGLLIEPMFLLIIALVFKYGAELKEEQDSFI